MGKIFSTAKVEEGKEMSSPEVFVKKDPLPDFKDLAVQVSNLDDMVDELADTIDDIFDESGGTEPNESTSQMETRLHEMTRNIQLKIHQLHKNLEQHSKRVDVTNNEIVMTLVRDFVSVVNSYMNMLMRNIQKLKRMIDERNLGQNIKVSQRNRAPTQHDIIPEQLDVDTMLMQLSETEQKREELETDILSVLVFWKDFKEILPNQESQLDRIDENVKAAADSVAHGLSQLNTSKN